jgi:hypothetical protein
MKLCIELDKETQKEWVWTKEDLSSTFRLFKKGHIKITHTIVLQCLLYCYAKDIGALPLDFVGNFDYRLNEIYSLTTT